MSATMTPASGTADGPLAQKRRDGSAREEKAEKLDATITLCGGRGSARRR